MGENPFLQDEEEYEVRKPFKKEELTEAQKKRNFRGIDMVKETLKKIKPLRVYK